jgi:hypothetical protein
VTCTRITQNRVATLILLGLSLTFGPVAHAQLETRVTTPVLTVSDPAGLAVADLNHDGKLDVVEVGEGVQIFLGNGDGTFQTPIYYAVGTSPNSVAIADFNGDGNLDLAVTNYLSSTVSILLGNGDGTFQAPTTLNVSTYPSYIAAGDLNGDREPDLVLLNGEFVSVFLNNGDGTFAGPINTSMGDVGLDALAVGDFAGNGTLDVAVAENTLTTGSVVILVGNGNGTFTQGATYPISPNCEYIAVGDFRRDGRLDLAVTDYLGTDISVLLGNGDGTFQPPVPYASYYSNWAAVADFNGDGEPDLIISNLSSNGFSSGSVSILLGNGDGTFQPQMVFPTGSLSNALAVGDFNGDHKLDVVDMDRWEGDMLTLLNTGSADFSPTSPVTFPTQLIGTTSAPLTATMTNAGTTPITIASVACSGAPFRMTKNTCEGSLAPGAQCTMTANFTAQIENSVSGTLTIHDSASSKPQVVELIGVGTVVKLSPPHLKFAPQKVGTKSAPQTIQLTNTGNAVLDFTSFIFINGKNYNDFSESDDCGSQIGAGASCTITVTFSPHKTGVRSAYVDIQDTGGGSPQEPPLEGTGD